MEHPTTFLNSCLDQDRNQNSFEQSLRQVQDNLQDSMRVAMLNILHTVLVCELLQSLYHWCYARNVLRLYLLVPECSHSPLNNSSLPLNQSERGIPQTAHTFQLHHARYLSLRRTSNCCDCHRASPIQVETLPSHCGSSLIPQTGEIEAERYPCWK